MVFCTLTGAIIGKATKKDKKDMFDIDGDWYIISNYDDILDQEGNGDGKST